MPRIAREGMKYGVGRPNGRRGWAQACTWAFGTEHLVERDGHARQLASLKVFGDRAQHASALECLLHRGDGATHGLGQLTDDRFGPAVGTGTVIEVVHRPKLEASHSAVRALPYLGVYPGCIWGCTGHICGPCLRFGCPLANG